MSCLSSKGSGILKQGDQLALFVLHGIALGTEMPVAWDAFRQVEMSIMLL